MQKMSRNPKFPQKKDSSQFVLNKNKAKIKFPYRAIYHQINNQSTPSQQRSPYSSLKTKINQEAISKIDRTISHQMAHVTSITIGEDVSKKPAQIKAETKRINEVELQDH